MKTETVNYQAKDVDLEGYVAFPEAANAPLILIAHTWAGKDEFVHQKAEDLAGAVDGEAIELNLIDLEPWIGLYYFGIGKLVS